MRGVERQEQIKSYIHASHKVTVADLSNRWNVTEETVRRDLDKLEEQGFITRIRGGAIWNATVSRSGARFLERKAVKFRLNNILRGVQKSSCVIV